ncbi:unannotated protein [freshwater metagenome]|uniref:Unannotated protein n=1 Tax=freshwater metagenome TaxID=449393 RepID=A0A6J7IXM5_9ZZZZ
MRSHAAIPLLVVCLSGAALSLQSFINGRLGANLGSAELAGTINYAVGLVISIAIIATTGRYGRAREHLRGGVRPRWWHYGACVLAAVSVIVPAKAAPEIGIALLTVALVCGQTTGSLIVDAIGLGPGGRRPPTVPRVAGVVIALAAVAIGSFQSGGDLNVGLVLLTVAAGMTVGLVQAALGHLTAAIGDPITATGIVFAIGLPGCIAGWLILVGPEAPGGWSAPAPQWVLGGLIGVLVTAAIGRTVGALGVLIATLALVAGQSLGGLVIDAVSPASGQSITARTILSVLLTFVAVTVSVTVRRRPKVPA